MAFAYTVDRYFVQGNKKVREGSYTNGSGDSGGDIDTGLTVVESIALEPTGDAVIANHPSINETLPHAGAITIVTTASEDGQWTAKGY